MRIIATSFIVMMSISVAHAESELNQLSADLDKYNAAQLKTPNHLIQYRDQNGVLLKNLFNPDRIELLVSDAQKKGYSAKEISAVLRRVSTISALYNAEFIKTKNNYDIEVIDQMEFSVNSTKLVAYAFNIVPIQKKDTEAQKTNIKVANAYAELMLVDFEKMINSGAFSPEYKPQATARLSALRQIYSTKLTNHETALASQKITHPKSSTTPPHIWSDHLQLNMQARACASKGYTVLSNLGMSSIVQNETYVYANYDSSRIAVKCVPMNDQSFVYIAVAGSNKDVVERLRNDIVHRMK